MKGGFLLDIVVRQGSSILQLLARENEPLLIRGNTLFFLNLRFHVVDCVRSLDLQRNGLAGEGFDEDLHTAAMYVWG